MTMVTLPKHLHPAFSSGALTTPSKSVRLNRKHPLFGHIKRYWLGNDLQREYATNSTNELITYDSATPVFIAGSDRGGRFDLDSTTAISSDIITPVTGSDNRTFLGSIYHTASNTGGIFHISDGTRSWPNFARWTFRQDASLGLRIEIQGAGYTSSLDASNGWHFVGCRLDGTQMQDHTLFLDGASENATGTQTVNTGSSYLCYMGSRDHVTGGGFSAVDFIQWGALFDIALTDAQIESIRRDPWQLLEPGVPIYIFRSAGGSIFQSAWANRVNNLIGGL